ncbi:MAG: EAL domain-containing protein [Actinobacteria bacterium]|nr:EAL domain-containing protein [Actinomycetota bacterium]
MADDDPSISDLLGGTAATHAQFDAALSTLRMDFQRIAHVDTLEVYGYEALLRCNDAQLGQPETFIEAAIHLGRLHELGRAIRAYLAGVIHLMPVHVHLFVNVHGGELDDEELYATDSMLSRHAGRVVLELTEHVRIDLDEGFEKIGRLRCVGYRVALDDYGTGHSELEALIAFEPEIVKLDMTMIRGMDQIPRRLKLVAAITRFCNEVGIAVIAEGVETQAELEACRACGIRLVQGYLVGRPTGQFA